MNPELKKLLIDFLKQLSDNMGNAGCNDYYWPKWVSDKTKQKILAEYKNHSDWEVTNQDYKLTFDFMVVHSLINLIEKEDLT